MISPHGTQDIPHGTHDIPHGTEHPPRYCTHIIQGECETYVSVNSKPDHPPGKTPRQFFDRRIPHPPGKKEFKTPTPLAYKNELKPHFWGNFPQLFTIKT